MAGMACVLSFFIVLNAVTPLMSSTVLSQTNASLSLAVFPFFAQRRPQVCNLNSIRDKLKKCASARHI